MPPGVNRALTVLLVPGCSPGRQPWVLAAGLCVAHRALLPVWNALSRASRARAAGFGDEMPVEVYRRGDRLVAKPAGDLRDRHAFSESATRPSRKHSAKRHREGLRMPPSARCRRQPTHRSQGTSSQHHRRTQCRKTAAPSASTVPLNKRTPEQSHQGWYERLTSIPGQGIELRFPEVL